MAAEHEAPERAAEEISQLLYHLQVLMLASGLTLDDVYASEPLDRPSVRPRGPAVLRIAVPNKGSLAEPAADMLRESGYRQRSRPARAGAARPGQRRRVLLPAARATSRPTSAPASSTSASPGATCCSTAARRPRRSSSSASASRRSGSPRRPGSAADGRRLRRQAGRHVVRRSARELLRRARRRRPRWSGWTARSRPRSASASPTWSPTWSSTGTTLRQAGPRGLRRADPGVRGGARPPDRRAPTSPAVDAAGAPDPGRHRRPPLRAHGLRRPRRAGRAGGPR